VTTESLEQARATADAGVKIEARDGTSRALAFVSLESDENGRPAELLDDARRNDADDADMPRLVLQHQHPVVEELLR